MARLALENNFMVEVVRNLYDFFCEQTWGMPDSVEDELVALLQGLDYQQPPHSCVEDHLRRLLAAERRRTSGDCARVVDACLALKKRYTELEEANCGHVMSVARMCELLEELKELPAEHQLDWLSVCTWLARSLPSIPELHDVCKDAIAAGPHNVLPVAALVRQHADRLAHRRHGVVTIFGRLEAALHTADKSAPADVMCPTHRGDDYPIYIYRGRVFCVKCCWIHAQPAEPCPISKLLPCLNLRVWGDKTPREVVVEDRDQHHIQRVLKADVTQPIVVFGTTGNAGLIFDGYHRLVKAWLQKLPQIPVKVLRPSDLVHIHNFPVALIQ